MSLGAKGLIKSGFLHHVFFIKSSNTRFRIIRPVEPTWYDERMYRHYAFNVLFFFAPFVRDSKNSCRVDALWMWRFPVRRDFVWFSSGLVTSALYHDVRVCVNGKNKHLDAGPNIVFACRLSSKVEFVVGLSSFVSIVFKIYLRIP